MSALSDILKLSSFAHLHFEMKSIIGEVPSEYLSLRFEILGVMEAAEQVRYACIMKEREFAYTLLLNQRSIFLKILLFLEIIPKANSCSSNGM